MRAKPSVFRSTGGKGWVAWLEEQGQFDRDPYHGEVPKIVMARGETQADALEALNA